MGNKADTDARKHRARLLEAGTPGKKHRKASGVPQIGVPVKLSEVQISRRPSSSLPALVENILENIGALVDGEALPIECSPFQRTKIIKLMQERKAKVAFGYNSEFQRLYIWKE